MDLQALLVFLGGCVLCSVVGYLVTVLGAKEQTYEEALKAQKERNKESKKSGKVKNNDINKKKKWKKGKGDSGGAEKNDAVPVVLVASSTKAKKRRKGGASFPEDTIVDPTGDHMVEERQYTALQDVEEDVVVVPDLKEDVAPLEATPEPSPLPTPEPKKANKSKKKKIPIEDVEQVIEVPVEAEAPIEEIKAPVTEEAFQEAPEEEVVAAEPEIAEPPAKSTPVKKAKKQKSEVASAPVPAPVLPGTPRDLLASIKRTSFNDEEAQAVINVLLTKQSGGPLNTSEEWIEQGKPSESQRLKQELQEANKCLEEERNNKIAFERQLTTMKKDLNEKLAGVKKAAGAEHQRILGEMVAGHTHQMNQANARMAEMHNNEMAMRGRVEEVQMEKMHTVTQYQAQVDTLSHQLQMAQNVPTPTFNDPSLLTELEQLRSLRDRYEGTFNELSRENNSLKEQVKELAGVQGQLQGAREEVSRVTSSSSGLSSALASAQAEASHIGLAKAGLEAELARLTSQLEDSKASPKTDASAPELATLRSRLAQKEAETVKLVEENERLAEQVASSTERPEAEGQEAGKANGHAEVVVPAGEQDKAQLEEWKDKFDLLHMDHEKMLAKQKVLQAEFEEKLSSYQAELEKTSNRNNELGGLLTAAEAASSSLLERLFPALAPVTEEKVSLHLAALASSKEGSGEVEKLTDQVEHYKTILAQTESMLTSLQSSVEAAEAEWVLKMEAANKELIEAAASSSSLAAKVASLEAEVAQADQAGQMDFCGTPSMLAIESGPPSLLSESGPTSLQFSDCGPPSLGSQGGVTFAFSALENALPAIVDEMQSQLAALQAQLAAQEEEKTVLHTRNTELSAKAGAMATQVEELSKGNTGLQAALVVAQEAVEKERGGVKALQEQLTAGKGAGSECGEAGSLNASIVSARSTASKASVARMGGSLHRPQGAMEPACPFPSDWQFGSVPDSITNEDELD